MTGMISSGPSSEIEDDDEDLLALALGPGGGRRGGKGGREAGAV